MRWSSPKEGSQRKITKFLLFSMLIDYEWRWLEKATYIEEYMGCGGWRALYWVDKD